jgi:molybdate transport system substrate-binding protein
MNLRKICFPLLILLLLPTMSVADTLQVAVAANFAGVLEQLAIPFNQKTGHTIVASSGATGKLYAQIKNGAPFEVLLSADASTPVKLEQEGAAISNSRFTYAVGKLVLWSARDGFVDRKGDVLKKGFFAHLAIANPKVAPYGAAAMEVLKNREALTHLESKIVQGENIAQTYQFIASGNAELGFVALSQVQKDVKSGHGSVWIVPEAEYQPIVQDAVVLNAGKEKPAVEAFVRFLKSSEARQLIQSAGYRLP